MEVIFSILSKKLNSTKRSSGGASYGCVLKSESGKTSPYIELSGGNGINNPTGYNYAYIPVYGRYYYVSDWIWSDGKWCAQLEVDVLASFKDAIGSTSLYILRASEDYDGKILDTAYPAKSGSISRTQLLVSPWENNFSRGSYVVGVISKSGASGAVAYYVLSYANMATLRSAMMSQVDIPQWGTNWDTLYPQLSGELIKAMINPFQYIASCMWLPFQMYSGGAASMNFGYWDSGLAFPTMSANVYYEAIQITVPDDFIGTEEEWRRQPPFAQYQLTLPPFGTIEIDGSFCAFEPQLDCQIFVDPITGDGHLIVWGASSRHVYADVHAQVGINVQIAQLSTDVMGAVSTTAGTIGGIASKALSGDIAGAISSAVSGVGNIAQATLPTLSTSGQNGGVAGVSGQCRFTANFRNIVDYGNPIFGRPLCKMATPASLGGFIMAKGGDAIPCQGTKAEKEQISRFIEGGFYYE